MCRDPYVKMPVLNSITLEGSNTLRIGMEQDFIKLFFYGLDFI